MRQQMAEARVGRLATITTAGAPHIVPCCFALDNETAYSAVDGKPKSTRALRRLENVRSNPRATLLVDFYDEDWNVLWWVRADANARVLDAAAAPEFGRAVDLLRAKYDQYRRDPPLGPVIALDITQWHGWP